MKNINLIKKKEADRWFVRNKGSFTLKDEKILDLIKINSIKANNILEIGCANGNKLNQYSKLCKSSEFQSSWNLQETFIVQSESWCFCSAYW